MRRPELTTFEAECLAELAAIEAGTVALECTNPRGWGYCNDVPFRTAHGWRFVVFNDCQEWDYLDSATAPDGREWNFRDGWDDRPVAFDQHDESDALMDYRPANDGRWTDAPVAQPQPLGGVT